jgi:hypothetical protein
MHSKMHKLYKITIYSSTCIENLMHTLWINHHPQGDLNIKIIFVG